MARWVPLKGSFFIASILGILFSVNLFGRYPSYAFAFMIVFVLMFVASLLSMSHAPLGSYDLKEEGLINEDNEK